MITNNLNRSFLITSFLLQYPNEEWKEALLEIYKEADKLKDKSYVKPILNFLQYTSQSKAIDLAEHYVRTFDFTDNKNLYLTYYKYKEDRKRGEELLKLKRAYDAAGFDLLTNELPDFLPLILEFTAISEKKDILLNYRESIEKIFNNLTKENNPYLHVLEAVLLMLQESSKDSQEDIQVLGGATE